MDDFAKEVITKMEKYEKKEKRQFNTYDMAIGLFYGVGIFPVSYTHLDVYKRQAKPLPQQRTRRSSLTPPATR